jgi:hypothetical protein
MGTQTSKIEQKCRELLSVCAGQRWHFRTYEHASHPGCERHSCAHREKACFDHGRLLPRHARVIAIALAGLTGGGEFA